MADLLEEGDPAGPPRDNGELQFDEPWQGRAFGLAVALHDAGRLDWDDFRGALVVELAGATDAAPATYWGAWLRATEAVVAGHGLVPAAEAARLLARRRQPPAGQDHHGHDHHHHHDHDQHGRDHHGGDQHGHDDHGPTRHGCDG